MKFCSAIYSLGVHLKGLVYVNILRSFDFSFYFFLQCLVRFCILCLWKLLVARILMIHLFQVLCFLVASKCEHIENFRAGKDVRAVLIICVLSCPLFWQLEIQWICLLYYVRQCLLALFYKGLAIALTR